MHSRVIRFHTTRNLIFCLLSHLRRGIIFAMQRKTSISEPQIVHAATAVLSATAKASRELAAWLAKYEPVEREIIEAHERRLANRARRRERVARAFGDLCEATEGFATVWRREG